LPEIQQASKLNFGQKKEKIVDLRSESNNEKAKKSFIQLAEAYGFLEYHISKDNL
tara:strand:+ start:205 stop:369 length:165 start_codon:yes stop_codon:yes gene_type:complete